MGFSAYSQMASSIVGSVRNLGGKIGDGVRSIFSKDDESNINSTANSTLATQIGNNAGSSTNGFADNSSANASASETSTTVNNGQTASYDTGRGSGVNTASTSSSTTSGSRRTHASDDITNDEFSYDDLGYMEPADNSSDVAVDINETIERGAEMSENGSHDEFDDTSIDPVDTD